MNSRRFAAAAAALLVLAAGVLGLRQLRVRSAGPAAESSPRDEPAVDASRGVLLSPVRLWLPELLANPARWNDVTYRLMDVAVVPQDYELAAETIERLSAILEDRSLPIEDRKFAAAIFRLVGLPERHDALAASVEDRDLSLLLGNALVTRRIHEDWRRWPDARPKSLNPWAQFHDEPPENFMPTLAGDGGPAELMVFDGGSHLVVAIAMQERRRGSEKPGAACRLHLSGGERSAPVLEVELGPTARIKDAVTGRLLYETPDEPLPRPDAETHRFNLPVGLLTAGEAWLWGRCGDSVELPRAGRLSLKRAGSP